MGEIEENLRKTRILHSLPDGVPATAMKKKKYLMTVRSKRKTKILEHKVFKAIA